MEAGCGPLPDKAEAQGLCDAPHGAGQLCDNRFSWQEFLIKATPKCLFNFSLYPSESLLGCLTKISVYILLQSSVTMKAIGHSILGNNLYIYILNWDIKSNLYIIYIQLIPI